MSVRRWPHRGSALVLVALFVVSSAALVSPLANPKPDPSRITADPIDVDARPITHFNRSRPAIKRFGRVEFRGGLQLTSPDSNFGGWSGITLSADGRQFLAVSDAGSWMMGEIAYDGERPKALRLVRIGGIPGSGGHGIKRERDRDSEAITMLEGTLARGVVLIAFERNHRIIRYPVSNKGLGAPLGQIALPPAARKLRANLGLEALCRIPAGPRAGTIVTFAERSPARSGDHIGWIQAGGASTWSTLALRNLDGFDIVDCAGLPDGSVLLLERRFRWSEMFSGVRTHLRRLRPEELASGRLIDGEMLLDVDSGYEIDNLEGLAVHTGSRGEVVITMISDDNFNSWLQRTILLQFTLLDDAPPGKEKAP